MAEELQQLLEKIQHDGVEKANAEAAAILAKAKAEAEAKAKAEEEVKTEEKPKEQELSNLEKLILKIRGRE